MGERVDLEELRDAVARAKVILPACMSIRIDDLRALIAELTELRQALADWEMVKAEPVVIGRLAVIKAAKKPKRMMGIGRFPITPVTADDDRLTTPEATDG